MFHHFTINCIWLMVFLHELKQVLVWSNSLASSIEKFLSSRYYSHGSTFSHSVVCKRRNLVKAFKFSKYSGPFSQMSSTRFVQCRYIRHEWYAVTILAFSQSFSFLSADLTWLDVYIWLSLFNHCLHSGVTWCNLSKWCFGLLKILNLLIKQPENDCKCLKQSLLREFPKKFQNNS